MTTPHLLTAVAAAALLAACGGGGGDGNTARGAQIDAPLTVATLTSAQIDAGTAGSGLQPIAGKARCDVRVVALHYATIGVQGENANASGVLLLPAGACAGGSYPLLAYARGTEVSKPRTLADPADRETLLLAAMYAAQGYAVVATDYLGFAKSSYSFHPYLHADSEASAVIDSIRSARGAASSQGVALSGKVMLTGYSQGGHASMAAQRAIERDNAGEINVVAGAHLAGPYNLSGSFRATDAIAGYQFFVPYIVTAWQKAYGNVYTNVTQAFQLPYSSYIENLLPSPTLTFTSLVTSGSLPASAPDVARDAMFQPAFQADIRTNPDNGLMADAKKNDLLGWNPKARTLLCGGAGDPTVPPPLHMVVAQADFSSRGLTNVTSVDVDPSIRAAFGTNGQAPTDPTSPAHASYFGSYHGVFEPPLCQQQARALFDTLK
ncbi:lipase family protein [Caenimonas terrae]|uniref:Lipase family protein n=1 Tax=Caenimonas terrae TaxID=696074 RepID=A0ABW0NC44_9BURK